MRIRRGPLFWGLLLIPLGAIPLLERAGLIDISAVRDLWRFWPLLLIVLGVAFLVGRSRVGLVATSVVALLLGGIGGTLLASGTPWIGVVGECGESAELERIEQSGTFEGAGRASLELGCGTFAIATNESAGWDAAGGYRGSPPIVEATTTSLAIRGADGTGRQEWTIALPGALSDIEIGANASVGTVQLDGATVGSLSARLNAGDLRIDGAAARALEQVDVEVNAGRVRLVLGSGPTSGELSVNAGAIDLCVAPDAALRLDVREQLTFAHNLDDRGLSQTGTTWTRAGDATAEISLSVEGNAGNLTLDPEGGCR